ncbi:MAG: phospholipase [Myxococcales bacterium]|nr:phospholipase [Myxococcales bacterium]
MSDLPRALSELATPDVETLLRAVEAGRLACPPTTAALVGLGLGERASALHALLGTLDRGGVEVALRVALAERAHRQPPRLDLVWTGPEAGTAPTRDTAIVVRQLFERARASVLVAGFRFDHGEELLRPLHAAMRDRAVSAAFFLDIDGEAASAAGAEAFATQRIDAFFAENWPFGSPRPDVYYDPRTAAPGPPWASLHAKCVVVDDRFTLIGSANFTTRGQSRNLETGVLIEDPAFGERVAEQWRSLVVAGLVSRYVG